jgi:hypothetical protein
MTEEEWVSTTDPTLMLEFLSDKASSRKLRLFAVACCRSIWSEMGDERSRDAVKVAERFADCWATPREQKVAEADAQAAHWETEKGQRRFEPAAYSALLAVSYPKGDFPSAADVARAAGNSSVAAGRSLESESMRQVDFSRDIFGNPFRPISIEPSWRTSTVQALATGIYTDKAFDRMPILGDALQDAGCENEDILNHCRQPGDHVRGCWVVDSILGKE